MKLALPTEITLCAHCGDTCTQQDIIWEKKHFCCTGCQTVYELLEQNNLCNYYDIDTRPGIKIKQSVAEQYAYLDDAAIVDRIVQFKSDDSIHVVFQIPTIHCSSCIYLLENLHKLLSGVQHARVHFVRKEIQITYHPKEVSIRRIVEFMHTLGYPPHISLENISSTKPENKDYSLLYQLGVAGFCSGNIMLLSFPEYLGIDPKADGSIYHFLGYINLLLALPVVVYSAKDYFITAFTGLKHRVLNLEVPISIGISSVFLRSAYEVLLQIGPGYFDSLTGLIFFLLIGKWYQKRVYQHFSYERDYLSYFPVAVQVKEAQGYSTLPVTDIQPGHIIRIRNEEIIPADGILTAGDALIDYSFVTGESHPVRVKTGDVIYAGGKQKGTAIEALVNKSVSNSYLVQLWNHDVFKKDNNAYLASFILTFSKYFTIGTLLIAITTLAVWWYIDPSRALYPFTSVLLIACPCAMALTMPFGLSNGLRWMSKTGFYLKNADTIEQVSTVDTIVLDKTGTLTDHHTSDLVWKGDVTDEEKIYIFSLTQQSTHPLSQQITHHFRQTMTFPIESFEEIQGKGIEGRIKNHRIQIGSAAWLTQDIPSNETRVYVCIDTTLKGYFSFAPSYRPEVLEMVANLAKSYEVHLLSGDTDKEKEFLSAYIPKENMHFQCTPQDKLDKIMALKAAGKRVLMLGDGLNDAGALKAAQVGIAVTDDTAYFTPASDGILEGKQLRRLQEFIKYSKHVISVIKSTLILSLLYNVIGLSFATQGLLKPIVAAILMPVSSVFVVVFVVVLTNWKHRRMSS
ncbi:MAG: heavy metal translocating P-type ATPase metal-binding domain-containing protein [Cytophagaceae bacterium]|jgi:Cu+-exporting ATPase|nr:heavy metal translocating P-type ATPase metal-binding domain-containing protein [Cytophagaceae bacterium]